MGRIGRLQTSKTKQVATSPCKLGRPTAVYHWKNSSCGGWAHTLSHWDVPPWMERLMYCVHAHKSGVKNCFPSGQKPHQTKDWFLFKESCMMHFFTSNLSLQLQQGSDSCLFTVRLFVVQMQPGTAFATDLSCTRNQSVRHTAAGNHVSRWSDANATQQNTRLNTTQ